MKKIFLVVSILFLTTFIYSKEFTLPDFTNNNLQQITSREKLLGDRYKFDTENNNLVIEYTDTYFYGANVLYVAINSDNQVNYSYVVIMQEMDTNSWVNFITDVINQNILFPSGEIGYYKTFSPLEDTSINYIFRQNKDKSMLLMITK